MDAGDDVFGRLILGKPVSVMMDGGIEAFRMELHAAATIVGSEVRNPCFTFG